MYAEADERDFRANARDAQIDADTLRRQAARSRQPHRAKLLGQAETLELKSAGWIAQLHQLRRAA